MGFSPWLPWNGKAGAEEVATVHVQGLKMPPSIGLSFQHFAFLQH
jgi:hypothetical protein